MATFYIKRPLAAILVSALVLALAACASQGPSELPPSSAPPVSAPPPPNMNPADFVGRWGLASYHKPEDRARTEVAARGQCEQAYVIARGPNGGLMMHLADAAQPQELRLKGGPAGKAYIGPDGPAGDAKDREIVTFDGRVMILHWVDPEVQGRYGNMVYVRCDGAGNNPPAKKKPKPKAKKRAAPAAPASAPPSSNTTPPPPSQTPGTTPAPPPSAPAQ